jgi:hypothetical protein
MSAERKRRLGVLQHNTLLDKLHTHADPRVRVAVAKFVEHECPPADAPRLRTALKRLEIGLIYLAADRPRLQSMVAQELAGLRHLAAAADSLADPSCERQPTDAWLKKFKTYAALLLVVEDDLASLRALAAEYLRGVYTGVRPHANVAYNIRLRSHSPRTAEADAPNAPRPWEGRYEATIQLLEDLELDSADVYTARFQEAACSSFIWKAKRPGRHERPGLVHHRNLTIDALADTFESLRVDLEAEVPLAAGIAAGFFSGLPWGLSQRVPLARPHGDDWVIWLDVKKGCYHLNLNPVVRSAASAKGNRNYVPATRAFRRFLPSKVAKVLQLLLLKDPTASALGVLCDSADVPPEQIIGADDGRVLKSSIARLFNSRPVLSRLLEIPAPLAAACIGDFARVPHSRLFYYSAGPKEVVESLNALEPHLNWGTIPVEDQQGTAIGAGVVPELQTLAEIASTLSSRVHASKPPRRYTLEHLSRFHNTVTDYSVYLIGLGVLSRDRKTLKVIGLWQSRVLGVGALLDKRSRTAAKASPVALCKQVQEQAALYQLHCKCMLRRLKLLGVEGGALVTWLQAVVDGTESHPFFRIDPNGHPRPRGTRGVYDDLPAELKIKADSARHFWDSTLASHGVPDELVDAQARRLVSWSGHWSQSRPVFIEDLRTQVGAVQQRVLAELGIKAVGGLRK